MEIRGGPVPRPGGGDQPQPAAAGAPASHGGSTPFVVVTGGSAGIGLALAARHARQGRSLLLIARDENALARAADSLSGGGAAVHMLACDVTAPDVCARLDAEMARLGGHVDLLVNSAGIGHSGAFAEAEPDLLDRVMAVNVMAPQRLMRHVLPGMRLRRRGGILNISSLGGCVPGPYQAAYYASKAALLSLSEAVAQEVARDGIRVTAVVPGPVETRFHARMGAEGALYRRLLPAASPAGVARWATLAHELGLRVAVPGLITNLGFVACWLIPHAVLVPIMAVLLHPPAATAAGQSPPEP